MVSTSLVAATSDGPDAANVRIDPNVARVHCQLQIEDGLAVLSDFDSESGRQLSLREIVARELFIGASAEKYRAKGIRLEENTPDEIRDVALEYKKAPNDRSFRFDPRTAGVTKENQIDQACGD